MADKILGDYLTAIELPEKSKYSRGYACESRVHERDENLHVRCNPHVDLPSTVNRLGR